MSSVNNPVPTARSWLRACFRKPLKTEMASDISAHEICIGELLSKLCKHSWDCMMKFVLINISNRDVPAV